MLLDDGVFKPMGNENEILLYIIFYTTHTETNNCEYECVNVPGSYECVCPRGFSQLGHRCLDIDECVDQPVRYVFSKLMVINFFVIKTANTGNIF